MFVCATIVAKRYLSLARVLARSFREHHPTVPFCVLLTDEIDGYFDAAREPFDLIHLSELGIPDLKRFRFQYAQQPLSYAATPYLLAHLISRGFSRVVFVKQESLVLGSLVPLVERLDNGSIVMTPHLVAPLEGPDGIVRELNILQSGSFNVGILGVAAGETTGRFLDWWQDRVRTDCRHAVTEGLHYEQRWLDLAPALFDGVHILRDPAFNVGHWNLPERRIDVRDEAVLVDGVPCRLFRFSGYDPDQPEVLTKHSRRLTAQNAGPAVVVFERFRARLYDEGYRETANWPYAYGSFDNGVPVPDVARDLYLRMNDRARFGDPLEAGRPDGFLPWLNHGVDGDVSRDEAVTNLWHGVYQSRPDLQRAFPDLLGSDRQAFLNWTVQSGVREHGIPTHFVTHRVA